MAGNNIIAFMGVPGAHADLACRRAYPYMETKAYPSFEDCFDAVENGEAELALIPIENSQAGRVAEIHNLLPTTKLHMVSEYFLPVQHVLAAAEGATLETVKQVFSHPQALMQSREHIRTLGYEKQTHSNTATAARDVADWKDPSKAAICSALAAELYGLKVIKDRMHDADDNVTVFVAFAKEPLDAVPEDERTITTLLFTARNIPAALYKCLGGFATNHVNMLKLESYIPGGTSAQAQFFITFEGSPEDRPVQLALEELGFFSKQVKVLGVYPADERRFG